MGNVIGIPNSRVSDLFVQQRLLNQVKYDQVDLLRLQTQLSTGRRIILPSEDPVAAMRAVSLQRLLERKVQVKTNLATNQSFLSATDTALSSVSSQIADVRAAALGVIGTTASDDQRRAAALQVGQAIQQLLDTGSQMFRGRYLFAGSLTGIRPFQSLADGTVQYLGNEALLESYADIDLLFATNLTGSEVFGAISEPVRGTADLNPVLTFNTRLADLNGGKGVKPGSIEVSNGSSSKIVDITGCETIGDVAGKMLANQPTGSQMFIEITPVGLEISLSAGTLSIKEVGGGTTASELGILAKNGVGTGPLIGRDLDPILRETTLLDDAFGARARAVVRSPLADNDFIVEAQVRGDAYNGVKVRFFDDGTVMDHGQEVASYDSGARTLWVNVKTGYSWTVDVVAAINNAYDPSASPFKAALDPLENIGGGHGVVDVSAIGEFKHGSGLEFDQSSGVQIVNGNQTHTLTFLESDGVETIEDLLNVFNGSAANVVAAVNRSKTGIDVRSRLSGCDFAIGENGGLTATELGLRTFNGSTRLEDLNFGLGVDDYTGTGDPATVTWDSQGPNAGLIIRSLARDSQWNGFAVSFVENVPPGAESLAYDPVAKTMVFSINAGTTTANDVISLFQRTPGARDDFEIVLDTGGGKVNDGTGPVACSTAATAVFQWGGKNNDLVLKARNLGPAWNGVSVNVVAGAPGFVYDRAGKTMTFSVDPGVTTVQQMIAWLQADADANADFAAYVDPADVDAGLPDGAVWPTAMKRTAGGATLLPKKTVGGFTPDADFTITRTDGVTFEIDVHGAATIDVVLDRINNNTVNLANGTPLVARLAASGNGIELVDNSAGPGTLTVTRTILSRAAIDLGLIPEGASTSTTTTTGTYASATFDFGVPNSGLVVHARGTGVVANGVTVEFADMNGPGGPGVPSYEYNAGTTTLTFWIDPTVTTANQVIALFHQLPPLDPVAAAMFEVELDTGHGPNTGNGAVDVDTADLAGGEPDLLTGRDSNPLETEGLFTALLRLHAGLEANDQQEIERAIAMLDTRVTDLNFSRASLGARQQGLDILSGRLEDENVELQQSLSRDLDADMVETISKLTSRQISYEASLRSIAQIFQASLLDYL